MKNTKKLYINGLSQHKTLLGILLVALLFLSFCFFTKTNITLPRELFYKNQSFKADEKIKDWKLLKSSKKGYPFSVIKRNNTETSLTFYMYSFEKNHAMLMKNFGSSVAEGNTGLVVSPNLLYTAYVAKDASLHLISNETLKDIKIPLQSKVYRIQSWSPDSKRILYSTITEEIKTRTSQYGMGMPNYSEMNNVVFSKTHKNGFHVFNIDNGTDTWLSPINYAEDTTANSIVFVTNSTILTRGGYQDDVLVTFDTDTFKANYAISNEAFGYGAGQFDVTPDGKKWTYTLSRNPTNDGNIIYSDFGKKEGITVASGGLAQIQWPKLSPNGEKLAYEDRDKGIQVYDTKTKGTKSINAGGFPKMWMDNNNLISEVFEDSVSGWVPTVTNVRTKVSKELRP